MPPTVSIIVPARDEERHIGKCLTSLAQLNYPKEKLQILVIDDGSADGTAQIIAEAGAQLLKTDAQGPSAARNAGLAEATGEFVAFTDADCRVDPEWLNELLAGFEDRQVAAVGGAQLLPDDESGLARDVHQILDVMGFLGGYTKNYSEARAVPHNASCNVLYRRQVLEEVGGFDPALSPGEDVDLDRRATGKGHTLRYRPQAVVYHYRPRSIGTFAGMMWAFGNCAGGFLLKRYGFFRTLYWEPVGVGLGIALLAVLLSYDVYCAAVIAMLCLLWPAYFIVTRGKSITRLPVLYLLFWVMFVSWNFGYVIGLLGYHRRAYR